MAKGGRTKGESASMLHGRGPQTRVGDCGRNPRGASPENNGRPLRLQVKSADRIAGCGCGSVGGADHAEDRQLFFGMRGRQFAQGWLRG